MRCLHRKSAVLRSLFVLSFLGVLGIGLAAIAAPPDKKTERQWKSKCASCHGPEGKGDTDQGKKMAVSDMTSKAWQSSHSDEQIKKAISDGVKKEKNGVKQEMDGYKDSLTPDQIDALTQYVRSLGSGK
jgi:cytochrome c6